MQDASHSAPMLACLVGIVGLAHVISSDVLAQQSFQDLESVTEFEKALAAVDAIKHRKKLQCTLSTANGSLCECLSQKLPVSTYVRSYAAIANQEKIGPEYGELSATDKKIVDQCISGSR
jgi:hypothetical protein